MDPANDAFYGNHDITDIYRSELTIERLEKGVKYVQS